MYDASRRERFLTLLEEAVCPATALQRVCPSCYHSTENCICSILDPQSGEMPYTVSETPGDAKRETVTFLDQNPSYGYTVDSQPDPSYGVADAPDQNLGDFFSRPVRIAEFEWATTDTNFQEKFDPWTSFFEDPRVANRISNYALLRSKLRLKFLINGNGFHYGRLIASYLPLPDIDGFSTDRAFFKVDVVGESQRPHIYLDPTTSQGGELVLPFFWYQNALSIPQAEWRQMGQVVIKALTDLKHANGATDSVTITVLAEAVDMTISIPTVENPFTLTPQSGLTPQGDEYGTGPISRPASIVARAAGALRSAPVIGVYARATEMAASAVSAIATSFGYSRPAVISDILPYRPTFAGNMSNTNVPDSTTKLTVDAKQETTIDPRVTGLGDTDELAIKSIAMRESYLTSFDWVVGNTPDTLLWNSMVTPTVWSQQVVDNNTELHFPPCCFAALPFRYWKGTMKFRFQIVSSNYHKGRIKIVYDPVSSDPAEWNTSFQKVYDIASNKDITVDVGWGSKRPYLEHGTPGVTTFPYNTSPVDLSNSSQNNGVIAVYVVNELTIPNSGVNNDISVNVFVSMCDDFEVASPTSGFIDNYTWFATPQAPLLDEQSGEIATDKDETPEPSAPVSMGADVKLGADMSDTDRLADICFGEKITSFRQMLKRYNFHSFFTSYVNTNDKVVWTRQSGDFPYYRGYVGFSGIHTAGGEPYNRCRMTLMNWVTPAYVGRRGGIRYKTVRFHPLSVNGFSQHLTMVERVANPTSSYSESGQLLVLSDVANLVSSDNVRLFPHGHDGLFVQCTANNPVTEYELPYQWNERFLRAKQTNQTSTLFGVSYHKLTVVDDSDVASNNTSGYLDYVAAAEDFSLMFFTGCPRCYYAPSDPNP